MRRRLLVLTTALLVGCSTASPSAIGDEGDVLFLAQRSQPQTVMEALYTGRVAVDQSGCLRLELGERHTVIWPYRFTLRDDVVLDAGGRRVGTLGGSFKFGGGEVPSLAGLAVLSDQERARAESRCPGRFWIVGTIVE